MLNRKLVSDIETNYAKPVKSTKITENCLVCAQFPFILFGSWIGISGMTYSCPHKGKTRGKTFKTSHILIMLSVPLCVILSADLANNINMLISKEIDRKTKFKIVPDIAFITASLVIMVCCMMSTRTRVKEFNGIVEIIDNRNDYGVNVLLRRDFSKNQSKLGLTCGFLALFCSIAYGLVLNLQDACALKDNCGSLSMLLGILLYYVQLTSVCDLVLSQRIYKELFQNCFDAMQDALERKRLFISKGGFDDAWSSDVERRNRSGSIEIQLKKLKELYTVLVYNFSLLQIYLSPLVAIWFTVTVMVIVSNTSQLIVWLASSKSAGYNSFYVLLQIRSFCSIFGITVYMYGLEIVCGLNADIMSYLYSYPITKLNFGEAEQAESILRTLGLQKPVLRISDVITLGIGILPSIGSTVLTYVLVVLQYSMDAEKN